MGRNNFRKALKHIESRSVDENIARLNNELKKTGMLSEKMTTSTVLPPTITQTYIPPTISDVPDTSGLRGDNFSQPTNGGDENDPSTWDTGWNNNDYLKNPNTLDGEENRPILANVTNVDYPYDDGGGSSTILFGNIAYGISVGVVGGANGYRQILIGGLGGGTNRPTERSRESGGIYRHYDDDQFAYAEALYDTYIQLKERLDAGEIGSGVVKVWKNYSRFHDGGGSFDGYSGGPKKDDGAKKILIGMNYFKVANTYTSDPGRPRTTVLNRFEDPSSPDFYEGNFSRYMENLLNVGRRGYDYLNKKSLELAGFGLRPDGTQGFSEVGDIVPDHFGNPYKLVPDPQRGRGMNRWVPVKKAEGGGGTQVAHYEPQGEILSEGWQSPDHTDVEKDPKTRWFNPNAGTDAAKWFDPKEVKPIYPEEPPEMIDGYSVKSNLAPKPVENLPAIKITKKDLLRNHRLKNSEIEEMMQVIDRINKFIATFPEELIYAQSRYPKHDPRLAELNWKMDQMLKASNEYLDKQFPENERLFNRLKSATQKTIELTDPETYKKDPGKLTSMGNLAKVDNVMNHYEPKDRVVSKIKMESRKSVNRFFENSKKTSGNSALKLKSKDLKKTRQRQIGEQNELASQKLKEQQKEELEREQIEEAARPFKSDWREETQLQENDWTPVAGSIANSSAQTFHYRSPNFETGEPNAFTVSGLGGVESVPSTTTIDSGFGETENVSGPNYSQLGLQGYAPPLGGVQRQTQQSENERIDAEIRKLEEQIKESKAKETAAIDAWNAEMLATMNRHGREWEAVLKKDGVYNPEKHKGLQARHDAEIEAVWSKEPKTEPYETERQNLRTKIAELEKQRPINQQLDASQQAYPNLPFMGARVQAPYLTAVPGLGMINPSAYASAFVYGAGLASAKNFVDHYIDNFVQGDGKQDQNLTNLLSRSDQNWLKNALSKDPVFTNPRPLDNPQDALDRIMSRAPRGIRNSVGNGAKIDMDYYRKTGDIKLDKDYVFTQEADLEYRGLPGNALLKPLIDAPKNYAKSKMGNDISPLIQNPMRFHVIIQGPRRKKKKKKEEELGESTWSRLKKYR